MKDMYSYVRDFKVSHDRVEVPLPLQFADTVLVEETLHFPATVDQAFQDSLEAFILELQRVIRDHAAVERKPFGDVAAEIAREDAMQEEFEQGMGWAT